MFMSKYWVEPKGAAELLYGIFNYLKEHQFHRVDMELTIEPPIECTYGAVIMCNDIVRGLIDSLTIVKVIYNDPATIVFWADGSKTIVKCQEGDSFSKETGLAMAFIKRIHGDKGDYNEMFKTWAYDD